MIKSYQDLDVWQKAMDLVVMCYKLCEKFPKHEVYGLSSQLQRAAVSVPANIAEGRQRQHVKEFIQHLSIAYGSLAELETHIQIAGRLGYIDEEEINKILDHSSEIGRMLNGLRACAKITSHFRMPSSDHLRLRLNREILGRVLLFLWFRSIGATKSDLNLCANSVNLFLREP